MKQIIFSAINDKGEPLLDFAIRKGEIWTARKVTILKEGDDVKLKRSRTGKYEAQGKVIEVRLSPFLNGENRKGELLYDTYWVEYFRKAGFSRYRQWIQKVRDIVLIQYPKPLGQLYFIHITNIRRLR